ncbi:hypothetical protein SM763_19910 [Pseudophaeobacter sp. C1-32P7]
MGATGLEFVSDRRVKDPVAFFYARHHFLFYLATVLFTLQFALCGDNGFDELSFWRVLESKVETLDASATVCEFTAQLDMEFNIACKALQVIKNDDVIFALLRIEIS